MAIKGKIISSTTTAKTSSSIPVRATVIGVGSVNSIANLTDVDVPDSGASDGSLLQFNGTSNKFEATTSLNNSNLTILCGGF